MHYIYKFTNIKTNMVYVGETNDITKRIASHCSQINNPTYSGRNSKFVIEEFSKYEREDFVFKTLHSFSPTSEKHILFVESEFISSENSLYPFGYNCKIYTKDGWLISPEYSSKYWPDVLGENNPNFGKTWDTDLKKKCSDIKKEHHASGEIYNQEWRDKISAASVTTWSNYSEEKKDKIMAKQSLSSSRYYYLQKTRSGEIIKRWNSIREILKANPTFRRQGIYSNVNGYKGSHRGFVWEKIKL